MTTPTRMNTRPSRIPMPQGPLPSLHACQFPMWDDKPTDKFCGKPTVPESSYCGPHHARCYHIYTPRQITDADRARRAKQARLNLERRDAAI